MFSHHLHESRRGERSTNQRNTQGEEPGIDEEVVAADLDDVEEQRGHRQQDTLSHYKFLHSILKEESQCLSGRQRREKMQMKREGEKERGDRCECVCVRPAVS